MQHHATSAAAPARGAAQVIFFFYLGNTTQQAQQRERKLLRASQIHGAQLLSSLFPSYRFTSEPTCLRLLAFHESYTVLVSPPPRRDRWRE
jgi:hypothetical protein